jgi:hypothetical protein
MMNDGWLINFLQIYFIFARIFARFCKFQERKGEKGADVNEGKFVLNIDLIYNGFIQKLINNSWGKHKEKS